MINIVLYYKGNVPTINMTEDVVRVDGDIIGFELKGHANFADHGEDIVCSSISILTLHTANALSDLTQNNVAVSMNEDGYLKLMAKEELDETGKLLMKAYYLSVNGVFEEYKDEFNKNEFINIKFKEV